MSTMEALCLVGTIAGSAQPDRWPS